jgi:transposase-like protein
MGERHLIVDHVTIWRRVQRYAPELNRHCRLELRTTNGSWRVDETYLRATRRIQMYSLAGVCGIISPHLGRTRPRPMPG